MKPVGFLLFLFLGLVQASAGAEDLGHGKTLIHAGELLDVVTAQVLTDHTVVVAGERVVAIEPGFVPAPNPQDRVINLSQHFVMPGLIDMHVHIASQTSPDRFLRRFTDEPADFALDAVPYARDTLMAGFTRAPRMVWPSLSGMRWPGAGLSARAYLPQAKALPPPGAMQTPQTG